MLGPVLVSFVIYKGKFSWPPLLFLQSCSADSVPKSLCFGPTKLSHMVYRLFALRNLYSLAESLLTLWLGGFFFLVFHFDKLTTMLVARALKVMLISIFGDPKGWETWRSLCYAICLTRLAQWWLKKLIRYGGEKRRRKKIGKRLFLLSHSFCSVPLSSSSHIRALGGLQLYTALCICIEVERIRVSWPAGPSTFDN